VLKSKQKSITHRSRAHPSSIHNHPSTSACPATSSLHIKIHHEAVPPSICKPP
jgi:hypothetical protein